jgi:hypothetical protein
MMISHKEANIGDRLSNDTWIEAYEGKKAVAKKNVSEAYLPLYAKWRQTKHLPIVHEIVNSSIRIVTMEYLAPFVFEESKATDYFGAILEICELANFNRLDISIGNIMMREPDKDVVFIDLWTSGFTPTYYAHKSEKRGLRVRAIHSLGLVLLAYQFQKEIHEWTLQMIDYLQSLFPTKDELYKNTDGDDRIYKHARGNKLNTYNDLSIAYTVYSLYKRVKKLEAYLHAQEKTFKDATYTIRGFDDKEYDREYALLKRTNASVTHETFMTAVCEKLGISCANNRILAYLHGENIDICQ